MNPAGIYVLSAEQIRVLSAEQKDVLFPRARALPVLSMRELAAHHDRELARDRPHRDQEEHLRAQAEATLDGVISLRIRLRSALRRHGITRDQVAAEAGYKPHTASTYLNLKTLAVASPFVGRMNEALDRLIERSWEAPMEGGAA